MKINPTIFRAYDIRGIYPDELNEEIAERTARAIAELYPYVKKMVIAADPRQSSPALSSAVIKGFIESGIDVVDIGIAPDPLFYFTIIHHNYDGGIVVSGSHNPKEYNGMTLTVREKPGEEPKDIIKEKLQQIRERVESEKKFKKAVQKGKIIKFSAEDEYIDYVSSKVHLNKPLKIIIDTANGACGLLPEKIFKKLGCAVKTLFSEPDGNFPNHPPDPYKEENLKQIKQEVLKEKADIGFAFDTDGDRVAPIDNKGRVVAGDFCMFILARQALKKKKGPIVHCMRAPQAFLDEMKKQGVKTYFSVSHHEAVREKIVETGAVFGGEITYHYFFPLDYYLCDEAVFSALKLAESASKQNNFADYVDGLPRYFASPEVFIDTPDEEKFALTEKLQKYLKQNNYSFIDVDGARIIFSDGWALARPSNTTPHIKCRFEGITKKALIEIEKKSLKIFKEIGIPVTKKTLQELGLS